MPIYWAFLTFMLLIPGSENSEYSFMFPGIDKIIHFSIFAFLGLCFLARFSNIKFLYYIYIMLIYAFLTEILQDAMELGRSSEVLDIVADTLGILIAYCIYSITLSKSTNVVTK